MENTPQMTDKISLSSGSWKWMALAGIVVVVAIIVWLVWGGNTTSAQEGVYVGSTVLAQGSTNDCSEPSLNLVLNDGVLTGTASQGNLEATLTGSYADDGVINGMWVISGLDSGNFNGVVLKGQIKGTWTSVANCVGTFTLTKVSDNPYVSEPEDGTQNDASNTPNTLYASNQNSSEFPWASYPASAIGDGDSYNNKMVAGDVTLNGTSNADIVVAKKLYLNGYTKVQNAYVFDSVNLSGWSEINTLYVEEGTPVYTSGYAFIHNTIIMSHDDLVEAARIASGI